MQILSCGRNSSERVPGPVTKKAFCPGVCDAELAGWPKRFQLNSSIIVPRAVEHRGRSPSKSRPETDKTKGRDEQERDIRGHLYDKQRVYAQVKGFAPGKEGLIFSDTILWGAISFILTDLNAIGLWWDGSYPKTTLVSPSFKTICVIGESLLPPDFGIVQ